MIRTVARNTLEAEAAAIEAHARESLPAFLLLGDVAGYDRLMDRAYTLRHAASCKRIAERREILGA